MTDVVVALTFNQLSEKAQQHALDKNRDRDVDHADWWNDVYEDAARMAALLGIDIDTRDKKQGGGPTIYFSGFWSQGDGASYTGWYRPKTDALECIKAETTDETLINLAERLTVLNVEMALAEGFEGMRAKITAGGSYSHSHSMRIDPETDPHGYCSVEQEKTLTACLREFADWIYKQLEAEHEYLTSDEHIKEYLVDEGAVFDEDGDMI